MINETEYTNNPLTKEQENQIDALFTQYDNTDTPGCAVGVIQDGRFIYKKSFGMANLDYDIPITSDSKFELASTSKQFTAACIALLIIDGKLDLDDDVIKFIPELPDYGKTITIRHLMYHISGIRDYFALLLLSGIRYDNYFDNTDAFQIICKQKGLDFLPSTKYQYSNSGYFLLAEIVHRVTGLTLRRFAEQFLFKPLGMNDTFFNDDCSEVMRNRTTCYEKINDEFKRFNYNFAVVGDGGLITTLNDMLKWHNNFTDCKTGSEIFLELMSGSGFYDDQDDINYGFGQEQFDYKQQHLVYHDGSFNGIRTYYIRCLDLNLGIVVFFNRDDIGDPSFQILDILQNNTSSESSLRVNPEETGNAEIESFIKLSVQELANFCGHYWCAENRLDREIYLKDGQLFYKRSNNSESELIPVGFKELAIKSQSKVKLIFKSKGLNKIVKFMEDDKCTSVFKSYIPMNENYDFINQCAGKFFNDELDIIWEMKIVNGKLVLLIKGRIISDIRYITDDIFNIIGWDCDLKLLRTESYDPYAWMIDCGECQGLQFKKITSE